MNNFADNVHGSKVFLIKIYNQNTKESKFNKFDIIKVLVLLCVNVFVCVCVLHSLTRDLSFYFLYGLSFDEQDFLILIHLNFQILKFYIQLCYVLFKSFSLSQSHKGNALCCFVEGLLFYLLQLDL